MKQVHLISMPWGAKQIPSIQIGSLKSYLKVHLPEYDIRAHHLHFSIPAEAYPEPYYRKVVSKNVHEGYYLYLLLKKFSDKLPVTKDAAEIYQQLRDHAVHCRKTFQFLEEDKLLLLLRATNKLLNERIVVPAADADEVIVGMTTNFHQTYANIYAYYYLREKLPGKKLSFVFGGASVSYPHVLETLQRLAIDAHAIIGEGERKLVKFIQNVSAGNPLEDKVDGIFHLSSAPDTFEWKESWYQSQIKSMSELPDPDYKEYFRDLDGYLAKVPEATEVIRAVTQIPIEGSRGCVFACEFCNLNRFWTGYRKIPGEVIAERSIRMSEEYGVKNIRFVDNLCDGWAAQYAETIIREGADLKSMMEIRPKHDESFWKKMADAGLQECQIGVEGLDDEILKRVKKGTSVMDVIFNHKVMTENLVVHGSRQIISYYPRSTMDEVAKTRETLAELLHMPKFDMSPFVMGIDSPLYLELSPDERRNLVISMRFAASMPEDLRELNVFFPFICPPKLHPDEKTTRAWSDLTYWYVAIPLDHWLNHQLTIDDNFLTDLRIPEAPVRRKLEKEEAEIYGLCHVPLGLENIIKLTGLPEQEVSSAIGKFLESGLMIQKSQKYLSLALRLSEAQMADLKGMLIPEIIR